MLLNKANDLFSQKRKGTGESTAIHFLFIVQLT